MNHSNRMLNDLVSIARDGKSFYEHAASKVADKKVADIATTYLLELMDPPI